MAQFAQTVAEFQGLYGPFTVAERVLQKIWLQRDFDFSAARLTDGRRLEIVTPGEWNLLGGPDFHGAQLRIDGREMRGDVEVHFHETDWRAHGHSSNPAYDGVVLHVLLFPPENHAAPVLLRNGTVLPTLVLLPLLYRDLEEYAADDALESITARDEWRRFAELGRRPKYEIERTLRSLAEDRWRQKVHFASLRIAKLGWPEAAHQTALEILGYKRNRAAMLATATRYPLMAWRQADLDREEVFAAGCACWQLHGVRPANHPRTRLRQYADWMRACPDWPQRLERLAANLPVPPVGPGGCVGETRQKVDLRRWRDDFDRSIISAAVGGTRLDTLVCDGLIPLAAARSGRDLSALWFNWYLGDVPLAVRQTMTRLGMADGRKHPFCHGFGQGLLGWLLEQKEGASP